MEYFNIISPYVLLFGVSYVLLGIFLFLANMYFFEKITPFNVKKEVFETQTRALGSVIRGQFLGQGIMIGTLIYFLGVSYDHIFTLEKYVSSVLSILIFGFIGIALFQFSLYILSKTLPIEREIILENNESLGMIIEGFLIAMSIIISVSLYSY